MSKPKSARGNLCCGIALALACVFTAAADTVTLTPVADTTLIEVAPNNNMGGQPYFNAGTTQNYTRNRGLLQFDVSAIPQDAVIDSVTLSLQVTGQPKDGYTASIFELHRMLAAWGEGNKISTVASPGQGALATLGEATWNDRFALLDLPWAAPGGKAGVDYSATVSGSQAVFDVGSSPYIFGSTAQMVTDVQGWVNDPGQNFGWMLISASEGDNFTARRFGSREDPSNAPLLTINFTVVPEPQSLALLACGGVLFWLMRKRPLPQSSHSPK